MDMSLGDRMKNNYEHRTKHRLPRRTYTIIRLDGKAFHSWTRGFSRPFCPELMQTMDDTTTKLCAAIEGAVLAYTQSDEISILLTDFTNPQTQAWFDGSIQKIASISASLCTGLFNDLWRNSGASDITGQNNPAFFDARVFTIPDPTEVYNYFVWRQQDATRNAISMAAQSEFSHKELHGVNSDQMQEMLWQKRKINFNDFPVDCRRGRLFVKVAVPGTILRKDGEAYVEQDIVRSVWQKVEDLPLFSQTPEYLISRIPRVP